MSQLEPAIGETEARPPSLSSHLTNAYNQWKSPSLAVQVGETAPDWAVRDVMYNRAHSKSTLIKYVVAMVFCGTWCVPCQWEVDFWKELHITYAKNGLRIMGMFLDFKESIPPFALAHHIQSSFHCCIATEKMKWDYGVNPTGRIPFMALVDRQGRLNSTFLGYHRQNSYEAAIKPLL